MNIQFFCPIWGMAHLPLSEMLAKIKNAGYHGIEFGFPVNSTQKNEFLELTKEAGLAIIAQQYDASGTTFSEYYKSFENNLVYLASFRPLFINCQTGKDYYSFEQNLALIELANTIEKNTGIPVVHETHRGRFSFCIQTVLDFIKAVPGIKFTADFSHFCTVSESYLQDQRGELEYIIQRAYHIHARVGHTQGPQVTDPRLPEWKEAFDHHLNWWDAIVAQHKKAGAKTMTITPEFGPAPYMNLHPVTGAPLASQWDLNLFIKNYLQQRYIKK